MAISGIEGIKLLNPLSLNTQKGGSNKNGTVPFSDFLKNAISDTNELIIQSDRLSEDFAAGKIDNIHQVLTAAEKADIALQFTMQIRNKIMDAYNEIMRMQI